MHAWDAPYAESYHRHFGGAVRSCITNLPYRIYLCMARRTRSGAQFSPFEDLPHLSHRPVEIIQTSINLDDLLEQAIDNAQQRAAYIDSLNMENVPELDLEDDDWEDMGPIASVPPSPVSSLPSSPSLSPASSPPDSPASSRSTSPVPSPSAPPAPTAGGSHPAPAADDDDDDDDDDDPEMPALIGRVYRLRQDQPNNHPAVVGIHKIRQQLSAKMRRKARRQAKVKASSPYDRQPKERHSQKHREQLPHQTSVDAAIPTCLWGHLRTLEELKQAGGQVLKWNGKDPKLVLDVHGRIIVILIGTPEDPDWDKVIKDAIKAMKRARRHGARRGLFKTGDMHHRRGRYLPLHSGVSFGGGQQRPGNLVHGKEYRCIVKHLLKNKSIRRIAGLQSTATFNCGPRSVAYDHLDFLNLAGGLCPLTVGGNFDHEKGAHLYLHQVDLIIECPSTASLLIPSACMSHGNTPLQLGETRCSITQYAAGGLFRWAGYGYQSAKSLLSQPGGADIKAAVDGVPGSRWKAALDLFSKYDELESDRATVFGFQAS
ncbi:hypothetical protein C8J57DRAFT_1635380 [Mycena rebaudengoi]|nr:hypothetical protein C8J57DRAFT_1635380 [Mycena rebaudengoi]